jgi:hypothetical protein
MEDTMVKNFILCLILMPFFVSCGNEVNNSNDENGVKNDQDISETDNLDDDSLIDENGDSDIQEKEECFTEVYDNFVSGIVGDESCVYPGERSFRLVHFVEPVNHEIVMSDSKVYAMVIDKIESGETEDFSTSSMPESPYWFSSEKLKYTDVSGIPEGEKCFDTDRYTVRFSGYDRSFFKDSMIGKKIFLHVYGNYMDGAVIYMITNEDDIWLTLNTTGSGGYKWDSVYRPGFEELTPSMTAVQKNLTSCKEICITEDYSVKIITDYTFQPPVEITIEGEETVLLRNGESKVVNNFEYFADFSVTVSENDPDGQFTNGQDVDPCPSSNGQFYFSVLNIGALK